MAASSADLLRPARVVPVPLLALRALVGGHLDLTPTPADGIRVSGITISSTRVRPGDLYVALPGTRTHGARFAADAVAAGAVAVLTDAAGAALIDIASVPCWVVDKPREVLGEVSAEIYRRPAERLRLLGVTGTQGKTTTSRLICGALEQIGVSVGAIGTLGTRIAGQDVATSLTTPEAPDLQALLAVMVEHGVSDVAFEVSSHALVLGRVDAAPCAVAGFTNLGRDHLDFHPTMADYYAAKAALFTPARAARAVISVDDDYGVRLASEASIPVVTTAIRQPGPSNQADWWVERLSLHAAGSSALVHHPGGSLTLRLRLPGAFNLANGLTALAMCAEAGHDPVGVAEALGECSGVPGRLESVPGAPGFAVLVDYAHKPDALEATLRTLRPLTEGRLLVVIGAGGDRDRGKRPLMGEIAARLADLAVITDDNPRSEPPAAIRAEVLAGARGGAGEVWEIGDRGAAIAAAIGEARRGDVVLIAGKGHESGQEIAGVVTAFDDRAVAAEILTALRQSGADGCGVLDSEGEPC